MQCAWHAYARLSAYLMFASFCVVFCAQLDHASDNKSKWIIAFFGWMVKLRFVKEVHLSMMTVGHTHEDINAVLRRVSEDWSRQRYVLTPHALLQYLGSAIPGS
eukprot:6207508-Pleurochrysis_carterae.AAC.1